MHSVSGLYLGQNICGKQEEELDGGVEGVCLLACCVCACVRACVRVILVFPQSRDLRNTLGRGKAIVCVFDTIS